MRLWMPERLVGGDSADRIFGLTGPDTLIGGSGDDTLWGGSGEDLLQGDAGSDLLIAEDKPADGSGRKDLQGGAGNDTLIVMYSYASLDGGDGDDVLLGGNQAVKVVGGAGNDTLWGTGWSTQLHGDDGDDLVIGDIGAYGSETLLGGDGADTLMSGAVGTDWRSPSSSLGGGAGHDVLVAAGGRATVDGGEGDDTLWGGDGYQQLLRGGGGDDWLSAGSGYFQQLEGGAGSDTLLGGDAAKVIWGGDGDDLIVLATSGSSARGEAGDDTMRGGSQGDLLDGGGGNDILDGGAGDDDLRAGPGDDTMTGGAGADCFHLWERTGNKLVTDYNYLEDVLGLVEAWTVIIRALPDGDALVTFRDFAGQLVEGAYRLHAAVLEDGRLGLGTMIGRFADLVIDAPNGVSVAPGASLEFENVTLNGRVLQEGAPEFPYQSPNPVGGSYHGGGFYWVYSGGSVSVSMTIADVQPPVVTTVLAAADAVL